MIMVHATTSLAYPKDYVFASRYHMPSLLIQKLHSHSGVTSKYTSLPSTAAIFLITHLMAVLQLSGYSIFHGGDTPIQLGLP